MPSTREYRRPVDFEVNSAIDAHAANCKQQESVTPTTVLRGRPQLQAANVTIRYHEPIDIR